MSIRPIMTTKFARCLADRLDRLTDLKHTPKNHWNPTSTFGVNNFIGYQMQTVHDELWYWQIVLHLWHSASNNYCACGLYCSLHCVCCISVTQHTNMALCMSQLTQYLTLVFQYVVSFRMLLVTYEYFKLLLLTMGGTGVK